MSTRNRWLDWKPDSPGTSILEKTPGTEPPKPTEPGFVSFVVSPLAISQKIEAEPKSQALQGESDTLGECKPTEIGPHSDLDTPTQSLKDQAVELWRDGRRFFLVADEEDAQEAMRRFGAHRGEVWASGELELVASIQDQDTRDEVESLKREMGGCLSPDAAGRCISAAEWQAEMLNQMFKEQGVTGQPAKITAAMVRQSERRTRQ